MTSLVTKLKDRLEARKTQIFDTPSMHAAIYLDPRVKHTLNERQKECAILYLKKILSRLQQLKTGQTEMNETPNNTLDELDEEFASSSSGGDTEESQLIASLASYENVQHVNFKTKVMDFWKERKTEFPLIYTLACVIHAIPANQSLEERNFSAFSYIRNSRRASLKSENLQNILTLRLNKELLIEQKQKNLEEIMSRK